MIETNVAQPELALSRAILRKHIEERKEIGQGKRKKEKRVEGIMLYLLT